MRTEDDKNHDNSDNPFSHVFYFGHDLDQVQLVMDYVKENYAPHNYRMWIGRGDDVMNALWISPRFDDEELHLIIDECVGGGEYDEEGHNKG